VFYSTPYVSYVALSLCNIFQLYVFDIPAFCVLTDGMKDSFILRQNQISSSDKSGTGTFRTLSNEKPFTTSDDVLNVTIKLTNSDYPSAPQIGKVDLVEGLSTNVGSYEVYYKKQTETKFTPFNSDRTIHSAEKVNVTENVLFPASTFATELLVVIHKAATSPAGVPMEIKLGVFACFVPGTVFSSFVLSRDKQTCTC